MGHTPAGACSSLEPVETQACSAVPWHGEPDSEAAGPGSLSPSLSHPSTAIMPVTMAEPGNGGHARVGDAARASPDSDPDTAGRGCCRRPPPLSASPHFPGPPNYPPPPPSLLLQPPPPGKMAYTDPWSRPGGAGAWAAGVQSSAALPTALGLSWTRRWFALRLGLLRAGCGPRQGHPSPSQRSGCGGSFRVGAAPAVLIVPLLTRLPNALPARSNPCRCGRS